MKYLIYGLVMLSGYGLSYGLLPLVIPSWLAVDMVLILVLCIAQVTKDYTASVIGACIGILVDIFISPAFGLCTMIYAFFGFFYAKISSRLRSDNFIVSLLSVFLFYLLKDGIYMLYGVVYGTKFEYLKIIWLMTLPSAFLNAAIAFIIYLIVIKLHELHCMKAKRELDFLRNYREQTDWLTSWFE